MGSGGADGNWGGCEGAVGARDVVACGLITEIGDTDDARVCEPVGTGGGDVVLRAAGNGGGGGDVFEYAAGGEVGGMRDELGAEPDAD